MIAGPFHARLAEHLRPDLGCHHLLIDRVHARDDLPASRAQRGERVDHRRGQARVKDDEVGFHTLGGQGGDDGVLPVVLGERAFLQAVRLEGRIHATVATADRQHVQHRRLGTGQGEIGERRGRWKSDRASDAETSPATAVRRCDAERISVCRTAPPLGAGFRDSAPPCSGAEFMKAAPSGKGPRARNRANRIMSRTATTSGAQPAAQPHEPARRGAAPLAPAPCDHSPPGRAAPGNW